MPIAHQTWFLDDRTPADWGFATSAASLALLGAALALTAAARVVGARTAGGVDVPFLGRLGPWMPFALRLHLAVSLVGLLALGVYLSPAMDLHGDVAGVLLGAVMALVAVGMATGWHARAAAWLLVAAGPLGMLEFGVLPVLQRLDMLGLALFVILAGPGRWSADHERGAAREPAGGDVGRALLALRLAVGLTLIVVAYREKLAEPGYAADFLRTHEEFQLGEPFGLGDLQFIRVAGTIEVLFGLLLISGALPQLVVVAAGLPFNATLFFFGEVELIGHLPVYGVMLALLVYGSDAQTRPLTSSWYNRA